MPLGKDAYEKALGRKLTDAEYQKLSGAASSGGATARSADAYEGATIQTGPKRATADTPKAAPAPFVGTNAISGKAYAFTDPTQAEDQHAKGIVSDADIARYRGEKGGDIAGYKPPAFNQPKFVANVPNGDGPGTSPLYLWRGDASEVEPLVKNGTISRDTADRIYASIPKGAESGIAAHTEVDYADGSPKFPKGAGYSAYNKSAFGDEMSASETGTNAALKAADEDAKPRPLQALVAKGSGTKATSVPVATAPAPKGPGTPLFQAATAPAPVAPPIAYDMGTTNVPSTLANKAAPPHKTNAAIDGPGAPNRTYNESTLGASMTQPPDDEYAAIISANRKKYGL